jgi:hypothetical protein
MRDKFKTNDVYACTSISHSFKNPHCVKIKGLPMENAGKETRGRGVRLATCSWGGKGCQGSARAVEGRRGKNESANIHTYPGGAQ